MLYCFQANPLTKRGGSGIINGVMRSGERVYDNSGRDEGTTDSNGETGDEEVLQEVAGGGITG